ncbi:MAG: hypothetical protein IAI48_18225 [Candidatus Eremiobacteraeota bacterium]|nr:hypothetical protein [Candidatus Eremiobacteraeota bacterium]
MRLVRYAAVLALACNVAVASLPANAFPTKPAHARMLSDDGILETWGVGNRGGEVTIRSRDGRTHRFAVADAIVVDGTPVRCAYPPKPGQPRDPTACDFWPSTLQLGKTGVRVSYWRDAAASADADRDVIVSLRTLH